MAAGLSIGTVYQGTLTSGQTTPGARYENQIQLLGAGPGALYYDSGPLSTGSDARLLGFQLVLPGASLRTDYLSGPDVVSTALSTLTAGVRYGPPLPAYQEINFSNRTLSAGSVALVPAFGVKGNEATDAVSLYAGSWTLSHLTTFAGGLIVSGDGSLAGFLSGRQAGFGVFGWPKSAALELARLATSPLAMLPPPVYATVESYSNPVDDLIERARSHLKGRRPRTRASLPSVT